MITDPIVSKNNVGHSSSHIWRTGLLALAAALLISYFNFSAPLSARAATLEPVGETTSYYVDSAMYNRNNGNLPLTFSQNGTSEANRDNGAIPGPCSNGQYLIYAIIDFGQPFSTYVGPWGGVPNQSWSQVENIALAYAHSWYNTSYNCFRMHLVIGVNNNVCLNWASHPNYDPCVAAAATSQAAYVEAANSSLAASGESWQIDVSGGLDAESDPGFGSYSTTLGFANAYNAKINTYSTKYQLYDFGDATHSCNLDWYCDPTSQVYNIAWNIGYDYPFPEAYSTGQNSNWQEVSHYSSSNPIQYSVALMDANQTWCPSTYYCWQDFLNKNGPWVSGGVLAGSEQLPLG